MFEKESKGIQQEFEQLFQQNKEFCRKYYTDVVAGSGYSLAELVDLNDKWFREEAVQFSKTNDIFATMLHTRKMLAQRFKLLEKD